MVQWLGPQAFTAEAQVQSLGGEVRSKLHSVAKKEKKKNHRLICPIDRKSKNPLQNMRKPNPATYTKDYIPQ